MRETPNASSVPIAKPNRIAEREGVDLSREPADQDAGDESLDRRADNDADNPGADVRVVAGGDERRQAVGDPEGAAEEHAEEGFLHWTVRR